MNLPDSATGAPEAAAEAPSRLAAEAGVWQVLDELDRELVGLVAV